MDKKSPRFKPSSLADEQLLLCVPCRPPSQWVCNCGALLAVMCCGEEGELCVKAAFFTYCCGLTGPVGGWRRQLHCVDCEHSLEGFVTRAVTHGPAPRRLSVEFESRDRRGTGRESVVFWVWVGGGGGGGTLTRWNRATFCTGDFGVTGQTWSKARQHQKAPHRDLLLSNKIWTLH